MKRYYIITFFLFTGLSFAMFIATMFAQDELGRSWATPLLMLAMLLHLFPLYVANYYAIKTINTSGKPYQMVGWCGTLFGKDKWPTFMYAFAVTAIFFVVRFEMLGLAQAMNIVDLVHKHLAALDIGALNYAVAIVAMISYQFAFALLFFVHTAVFFNAAREI